MAPAGVGFHLLPLLLLGLWLAVASVSAKPRNMTSAQWFKTQHIQLRRQSCNAAMRAINKYTRHCKDRNSFLHEPFSSVATACQSPSVACKNGHKNCHQSPKRVPLTDCRHTSGKYPDCRYKEKQMDAYFIVACDPPEHGDSGKFKLVPVHLDKVFQISDLRTQKTAVPLYHWAQKRREL
ncbi:ribonuclease 7-like isoform X2 [Erinaceus europaeus]|uniref:Ribonuclease 7-like isoform X2 n=1 Tax=Erinaceus europaeus TaxID=9365 RepID=A0ABM3W456_ERIEU|nr:ribonuclease 7-like isoform X2 [Erinaceus europaeus]